MNPGNSYTEGTPVTVGRLTAAVRDWASLMGLSARSVLYRLSMGWPVHEAIAQPKHSGRGPGGWRLGVPYEFDAEAQRFVDAHPHGATLAEIGEYFGVNRERVRQIETDALASLRRAQAREEQPTHEPGGPRLRKRRRRAALSARRTGCLRDPL